MLSNRPSFSFGKESNLKENVISIHNGQKTPAKTSRATAGRRALGDISNRKGSQNSKGSQNNKGSGLGGLDIPKKKSITFNNLISTPSQISLSTVKATNENSRNRLQIQQQRSTKKVQFGALPRKSKKGNPHASMKTKHFGKSCNPHERQERKQLKKNSWGSVFLDNNEATIEYPAGRLWSEEPDSDEDILLEIDGIDLSSIREDWVQADEAKYRLRMQLEQEEILRHERAYEQHVSNFIQQQQQEMYEGQSELIELFDKIDVDINDDFSLGPPSSLDISL